ncbi:ImmA/IrrE family metallo-endopeptidase [Spirosoma endophyticum]|uniref:IrrE N-terminal-like domain-containing protein n=1 Tax=Spirosoma endophyticum TaxID=662367 RepID=A0A1I2FDE0_9BACT|nr:ImmA/IrrE family metallo-endopeptidase [Spirosoma endophyticum]SFF03255.1 protein of unknown function [Spirosoma endophyticum]
MSYVFWNARQRVIAELAETIAATYFKKAPIEPALIADEEGISYCYGHYQNSFDGLLHCQEEHFHIFLNLDRLGERDWPRTRFTFGHELGHYFIDEHRNELLSGKTPAHPSFNKLFQKNPVEIEADYFASCLLMPADFFRNFCVRSILNEALLENLSKHFQTSLSSTIFRYYNLNISPIAIIMSKAGKVEKVMATSDFKFWGRPVKGSPIPPTTVAGEYYTQGKKYDSTEQLFADDWFTDKNAEQIQLYEKCYYLANNSVISLIWIKERY